MKTTVISSRFLYEATDQLSSRFLREATGTVKSHVRGAVPEAVATGFDLAMETPLNLSKITHSLVARVLYQCVDDADQRLRLRRPMCGRSLTSAVQDNH